MREVMPELMNWWREGQVVGVGTVVATFRSAPRPPGSSMLVGPDGSAVGSVSGGCVEGSVYDLAQAVVKDRRPVMERYGVSDDDAFAVGLTCGGILDVFVQSVDQHSFPELGEIADDIGSGRPVALAVVIAHPEISRVGRRLVIRPGEPSSGDLGSARVNEAVHDDALGVLAAGSDTTLTYGPDGERLEEGMRVFVWAFAPPPRMLVFGAIDFASAVARAGSFLGYHVTVCDARSVFATKDRFPDADEVVVDWPHRYFSAEDDAGRIDSRTVIALLTHDPKFDVPLLAAALRHDGLSYIGAMGSRQTHADRLRQLRERGLSETDLERLHSPIGLDLGARTPEETAISIVAEMIATQWGGSGRPLRDRVGRIHLGADSTEGVPS